MLLPGKINILPHYTQSQINKINTIPAKDYIISWFEQRVPARRGGVAMLQPKSVNDKIMILLSGTGSGKSTTLGPELYKTFYDIVKKNIAVTQPRVLTAMAIPDDIVDIYPEMYIGDNIGYQTGDYAYKPKGGVVFMTVGVLAQQLKTLSDEEIMDKYAFIVIDECHDRSLDMDLTLSLIKSFIHRNYKIKGCPFLILTSATFDTGKYADYFEVDRKNIISVQGLNYPIECVFQQAPVTDYIAKSVQLAIEIHNNNLDDYKSRFTDILIFVYGSAPMKEIATELNKQNNKKNPFITIELTGASFKKGDAAYRNIFKPLSSISVNLSEDQTQTELATPNRRIIISTNVAETGVTIDTLKYLIDTGYENSTMFNPVYGSDSLLPKNVTTAGAMQRKGRVGRRAPGVWYPLYTEDTFKSLHAQKFPDIIASDITDLFLGLMVTSVYPKWDGVIMNTEPTGSFDIDKMDLLDRPTVDSIKYSVEKLFVLGFIDNQYRPTTMGLLATSVVKLQVESIRMILAGYQHNANILDLITIASFMQMRKSDYIDTRSKTPYTYKTLFKKNDPSLVFYDKLFIADDFIEVLFIWDDFIEQIKIMRKKLSINHVKNWCDTNGLQYEGLLTIVSIRDDLISTFVQVLGLDPYYNGLNMPNYNLKKIFHSDPHMGVDEVKKLKKCIYEGYRMNTATWNENRTIYQLDCNLEKVKVTSDVIKPLPAHDTFRQIRPKKIIVQNISLSENIFNGIYQFGSDRVSSLDMIDVDNTFTVS
jgi:HrpA-like RNA helicase